MIEAAFTVSMAQLFGVALAIGVRGAHLPVAAVASGVDISPFPSVGTSSLAPSLVACECSRESEPESSSLRLAEEPGHPYPPNHVPGPHVPEWCVCRLLFMTPLC